MGPPTGVEVEPLLGPGRHAAHARWDRRQQLQARCRQQPADAELTGHRRCGAAKQQRLDLAGRQAGETGAVPAHQSVATALATLAVDGHAGRTEVGQVAVDGADRDVELVGELLGGGRPAGLEHEQDTDEPRCAHGLILVAAA